MFASLFRSWRRPARSKPARPSVPLRLETLEERWVPSATGGTASDLVLGDGLRGLIASNTQTRQVDAAFAAFPTGGSQTQTVPQFNPALGTLTGIQIVQNGTLNSDIQVQNFDAALSNITAQLTGLLTLQGPGFHPLSVSPTLNDSAALAASGGSHNFGAQAAQASQSINLSAAENDLSAWIGTGTVPLTEKASSSLNLAGSGNLMAQANTTAAGNAQVIYSYTPPDPPPPPPPTTPPPTTPPTSCTPPSGPGSLSGIVYVDSSGTCIYAPGEAGVAGVTVNLIGTTVTGQSVNEITQTAADGTYHFTNLQAGLYELSTVQPSGYTSCPANLGSLGGNVQGGQTIVALPQGGNGMCYDFGEDPVPPPAPPPPPSNGGLPTTPPPASTPADAPTPTPAPVALSKRLLIGDGWQSLG